MEPNDIAYGVIGAAIEVHKMLGPGLLESAYQTCLERELALKHLNFESQVPIAIKYKGVVVSEAYRADLLVENKVVVELKTIDRLVDIHKAQLLTYLKMTGRKLGLLINFNVITLRQGICRVVHQL